MRKIFLRLRNKCFFDGRWNNIAPTRLTYIWNIFRYMSNVDFIRVVVVNIATNTNITSYFIYKRKAFTKRWYEYQICLMFLCWEETIRMMIQRNLLNERKGVRMWVDFIPYFQTHSEWNLVLMIAFAFISLSFYSLQTCSSQGTWKFSIKGKKQWFFSSIFTAKVKKIAEIDCRLCFKTNQIKQGNKFKSQ